MKTNTETELRELDAWIAEHVMGWSIYKTTKDWANDGAPLGTKVTVLDQFPRFEPENYSTDPAAAMQVLEKCLEKKNSTRGLLELMKWNDSKFSIYSGDDCQSTSETLPLAICKFAKQLFSK